MLDVTLEGIFNHLKQKNLDPKIQHETQQVYVMLSIHGQECPLFFRIFDGGHLVQLLAFIPCTLDRHLVGDMARLLHILNKELDIPGFGMDETASVIFYRFMLPTADKKLDSQLFDAFLKTFEQVCNTFTPPIQAIGSGAASLDEVLKQGKNKKG